MPNHVTNTVLIEGGKDQLDKLIHDGIVLTEGRLDFDKILPRPSDDDPIFTAEKHDYGNGAVGWSMPGYSPLDWHREHWGTKWNSYSPELFDRRGVPGSDGMEFLILRFDTAWAPPHPIYAALENQRSVTVHAIGLDEDEGAPPSYYGDPFKYMWITRTVEIY